MTAVLAVIAPVLTEAGQTASLGWLMGVTTTLFMVLFVLWTAYAWAPWRRDAMDEASRMPLDDDGGDA